MAENLEKICGDQLTALALDGLVSLRGAKSAKPANLDRELLAQGFANSVSGFVGGLPMTGVIVRSAVNVSSGARTRASTILHGLWIALFVILAPGILMKIPLTALAAVLVVTGIKLLNVKEFIRVYQHSKWHGSLWIVTFGAILTTDLLSGLVVGIITYFLGEQIYRIYKGRQKKIRIPAYLPNTFANFGWGKSRSASANSSESILLKPNSWKDGDNPKTI